MPAPKILAPGPGLEIAGRVGLIRLRVLAPKRETSGASGAVASAAIELEESEMQLLVACAWCERIELDGWVEPAAALRQLRTYEWPAPPRFSHGICDRCVDELARRRGGSAGEALAA